MCKFGHMGMVGKAFELKFNPPKKLLHQNSAWKCLHFIAWWLAFQPNLLVSGEVGCQKSVGQESLSLQNVEQLE